MHPCIAPPALTPTPRSPISGSARAARLRAAMAALGVAIAAVALALSLAPLAARAQTGDDASVSLLIKLAPGLTAAEQSSVLARNGGRHVSSIPALHLHVIDVATSELREIVARYQSDPRVAGVEENRRRRSETTPVDPLYANQWALPRIGWDAVFGGVAPTAVATVALLDTGIDGRHPDLAGVVVPGFSTIDGSDGLTDPSGHGTALAGIVAARTNNRPLEGIAGVAFAGVQVMPVTVLGADGTGRDSDIIAGVIWAADHGADVILMAFSNPGFSASLQDAIDYAWSRGAVLVGAAGNDARSDPTFPAGARGVIGVAATDRADAPAYFSNEGQSIFLAAPGTDIQTTALGDAYMVASGTSTAAAIVSGVAAFMRAVDSTLPNGVIVGRLARTADPAGSRAQTGNGRINMPRALADVGLDVIRPAGAAPVGDGGPFIGPYRAAVSTLVSVAVGSQTGTLTFGTAGSVTYPVTVTRSGSGRIDVALSLTAGTALPTGASASFMPSTVTFTGSTPTSTQSTLTITAGSSTPAGTTSVTVKGTDGDTTKTSNAATLTIARANQTITFGALGDKTFGDAAFTVAATASSGLPVTFGSTTAATCSVSGTTVTLLHAGTCTVRASQAGNGNYNAAANVDRSFTIAKANQTITFGALGNKMFGDAPFTVAATASSGLPVTFASTTTATCSVTGSTVTLAHAGTCTVRASQAGDGDYNAGASVDRSFTIARASQTIAFAPLATRTFGDVFTVAATASSGAAVTFSSTTPATCSAAGNLVSAVRVGSCTIRASQAGTADYDPATDVEQSFTIQKATAVIGWNNPADIVFGAALGPAQLNATAAVNGSPVAGTFVYTPPAGTLLNAGNAQVLSVTFTPTDTTNLEGAVKSVQINVAKATPVIGWNTPADIVFGEPLGASQLNATVAVNGSPVAGTFVYTPPGGTLLAAGNAQTLSVGFTPTDATNLNAAAKSVQINVAKATPLISWSNPPDIVAGTPLSPEHLNATASFRGDPVAGGFAYTPPAGTLLDTGNAQSLSVTFTPADGANYNPVLATAQIDVGQSARLSVSREGTGGGTVTSAAGDVECSSSCSTIYRAGTRVSLRAAPASDSMFDGWSGACTGLGACEPALDADAVVVAVFTRRTEPERFVVGLYQRLLGRTPSAAEAEGWLASVDVTNAEGVRTVVHGFFDSDETLHRPLTPAGYVASLYEAILQRVPSEEEVAAWEMSAVVPRLGSLVGGFIRSPEFRDPRPDMPAAAVITRLYGEVLGRAPAPAEIDAWLPALATQDYEAVVSAFFASSEYRSTPRSLADRVRILYRTLLGRDGSPEEIRGWLDHVAALMRPVQDAFIASPEFQTRIEPALAVGRAR